MGDWGVELEQNRKKKGFHFKIFCEGERAKNVCDPWQFFFLRSLLSQSEENISPSLSSFPHLFSQTHRRVQVHGLEQIKFFFLCLRYFTCHLNNRFIMIYDTNIAYKLLNTPGGGSIKGTKYFLSFFLGIFGSYILFFSFMGAYCMRQIQKFYKF